MEYVTISCHDGELVLSSLVDLLSLNRIQVQLRLSGPTNKESICTYKLWTAIKF